MHFSRREILALAAVSAAAALLPGRGRAQALLPGRRRAQARRSLAYGGFTMGLQSFTLRKLPLPAMLDAVQRLGLSQVELIPETKLLFYEFGSHFPITTDAGEIARVNAALAARGIRLAASGVHGVSDEAAARRLFAFAQAAGIPLLTIMPDDEALGALDRLCTEHPTVKLGIHNHGPYFRYDKIADVEQTLAGRHPNFGACVDAGHFIRSGEDPAEALRRLGPRVHGVHLKDFRSEGFFAEGCILGQGKLDLDGFFRSLRAVDFAPGNALSLEYEEHPDDPIADIEACLRAASESAERVARG
jgi:sugar phosphate isomerase/epimerase